MTKTSLHRSTLADLARLAIGGRAEALAQALREFPDQRELADAAEHHGLAPIFHAFSQRSDIVPPELAARLAAVYRQNKARSILLLDEAERLMKAFEARGIPCIPLKGAALADDLYHDPALRPMTDVDLLIPRSALPVAREMMTSAGYDEEEGDLREGFEEEFRSELSYFRTVPRPCRVEIHWGLLNFGGHEAWTDSAIGRSVMTPRGRRLSNEDTLLYLAAHAAYHHQNDRLLWEFDIALLLQTLGATLDPWTIGDLAQRYRLLMPFRWALETGERFGVPAPPALKAVLENRRVGRIERWILRFARDPQLASVVRTLLTVLNAPDGRSRRRLLAAKMFPDRHHLEVRHQMRGFWPWIYTKRLVLLGTRLLLALRPHREEK